MSDKYDLIVIGAGPAGYVAAIRAAQLGMSVACIDKWLDPQGKPSLGGTCLNAGCIPSKALLESSELYHRAQHDFASHGLKLKEVSIDVAQMQKRKGEVVSALTGGIGGLFKANGVEWLQGTGQVQDTGKVSFKPQTKDGKGGKKQSLTTDKIIIASGSEPVKIDVAPVDGKHIVDSTGALEFDSVPKRLGVIGAGYIGVELGSVWSRLGSETVLLEALDTFLPIADQQIAKEAFKQFKKQGLDLRMDARVISAKVKNDKVEVEYQSGDEKHKEVFDKLIVAVGRRPYTEGLIAKSARIELDEKGFIAVNDKFRTGLPGVYAVGDVIGNPMLAHKGMEEGAAVAEILAGQKPHVNYQTIPSVVYTAPEIAWVGKTEEQLKSAGTKYRSGVIPFAANGRAKAIGQQIGMIKILADAETDEILGAHMLGPYVSELIQEIVVAMEFRASSEDIARIIHGHPTLSESVHEAALAVDDRPIHFAKPKRAK